MRAPQQHPVSPLRQQRLKRGWTQDKTARELQKACRQHKLGSCAADAADVGRWERNETVFPHEPVPEAFSLLYDVPVEVLWPERAYQAVQELEAIDRRSLLRLIPAIGAAALLPSPLPTPEVNLAGVWHSMYRYHSDGRGRGFEGHHMVLLEQSGNQLLGKSLPHSMGSELELDLNVKGVTVEGTWWEKTSPSGYYRGAEYHGALHMLMLPNGRSMAGKWLGFSRKLSIKDGPWSLVWEAPTEHALQYHKKV